MNFDFEPISWSPSGAVRYLDQTLLPEQESYREAASVDDIIEAIHSLRVRGAPMLGIVAAMGLAAAAAQAESRSILTPAWLNSEATRLAAARPTAVNLAWAVGRVRAAANRAFETGAEPRTVVDNLRSVAQRIWDEDRDMCQAIGEAGAEVIRDGATVLTHCNAGALATGGIGTALAAIYVARDQGKPVDVISCEARPLRQGARLTSWELARAGIKVTAIVDSAAGAVMAAGEVDLVITGADRIAANGDVANKIGTYGLAVLAQVHHIPFFVAAPRSTFDISVSTGGEIPIELRAAHEVDAAPGAEVYNPAFDVTPASLVTGIITDRGLVEPPYLQAVPRLLNQG
jgi:methylthioribose-1-phosphate isomerase